MAYLTYQEYIGFGFTEIDEEEFNRLLPKASDVVDSVTRLFYKFNDIDEDVEWRREQFKKAVACQIEYFHEAGATSSYGINEPSTVTIGRTSMSAETRGSNEATQNGLVAKDVYMYLAPTGLLYGGVEVRS